MPRKYLTNWCKMRWSRTGVTSKKPRIIADWKAWFPVLVVVAVAKKFKREKTRELGKRFAR